MKQKIKMYCVAALCGGCLLSLAVLMGYLSIWYIVNYSMAKNPLYYVWCGFDVLCAMAFSVGAYVVSRNIIDDGI